MRITFACYESLSIIHGGPRVQMLRTKAELEALGTDVRLLNPWEPLRADETGPVHLFSANLGTFHLASVFHQYRIPFVTSSIFFTRHSPLVIRATLAVNAAAKRFRTGIWTNYEFTRQICDWSRIVSPNTDAEARLIADGMGIPRSRIETVPNGVDERFRHGDPALFRKTYGMERYILSVGHIGPERKNALNLIRALKRIDHPAVIIGQVTDSAYARRCLDEAKEAKHILIIPGLANDSEMLASAYAGASVFALPSLFETPGIAALEAGLAGANIVITPHGGTKEYFLDMAEYVEPGDPEGIRRGIEKALERGRGTALQQHIGREYLWNRVAEKTLAMYRKAFE
ncbi:MAG: glycosyltransferase [Bacteroidetes bacterium]|nr:MAG: glycosyltransferase [Bacteroidota bacterium]